MFTKHVESSMIKEAGTLNRGSSISALSIDTDEPFADLKVAIPTCVKADTATAWRKKFRRWRDRSVTRHTGSDCLVHATVFELETTFGSCFRFACIIVPCFELLLLKSPIVIQCSAL
jgi:hypothetical protein